MGIAVVMMQVDDAARNIRAVITDARQSSQQVGPDKTCLNGAVALLQTQDMVNAELFLQIIDHLPRDRIHAVTVVPTFAPMITLMA